MNEFENQLYGAFQRYEAREETMDPTKTLSDLLAAIAEHNSSDDRAVRNDCRDDIYDSLWTLQLWIGNGGFIPTLAACPMPTSDSLLDNWPIRDSATVCICENGQHCELCDIETQIKDAN